ncbi:MAG: hypothetical protein CL878_14085 [Dehalococcoidia bacterium]|nr:hypothetical protein [Dehalococcoidia bacterium]
MATMLSDREKEDIRVGYQVAASLWAYEGQVAWMAYSSLVVANSIVLAAQGATLRLPWLSADVLLSATGILLCAIWFLLTLRHFAIHEYRVKSTRELEEALRSEHVKTVSRGAIFSGGDPVVLSLGGAETPDRLPYAVRRIRGNWLAFLVIGIFSSVHAFLFLTGIHRDVGKYCSMPLVQWLAVVAAVIIMLLVTVWVWWLNRD